MPVRVTGGGGSTDVEGRSVASGVYAHAEGVSTASGAYTHAEGNTCVASGDNSRAEGKESIASRVGQRARASGRLTTAGDNQTNEFTACRQTSNATPTELWFNLAGSVTTSGALTNVLTIPVGRAHRFRLDAVARRSSGGDEFAAWTVTGTLVRGASGNARFIATPVVVTEADVAAAAWTLAVAIDTADSTNNYMSITVTGEAAKTIRWACTLHTTEIA